MQLLVIELLHVLDVPLACKLLKGFQKFNCRQIYDVHLNDTEPIRFNRYFIIVIGSSCSFRGIFYCLFKLIYDVAIEYFLLPSV